MKSVLGSSSPVVLFMLTAAFALAQEPAPAPDLTIRQTVQEIVLDVVVRDARGRMVKNLKQSDLEVFEDGVRQQIQSFRFVQGRDVVLKSAANSSESGNKTTVRPAAAAANPLKAVNLICLVFANVDFTNPNARKYAVDAVREFVNGPLEPNTWIAVFNLDSQLKVLHQFTTDRKEIIAAANNTFTGMSMDFVQASAAVLTATPNMATIEVTTSGNPAQGGSVNASQKISGGELNPTAITGADVPNSESSNRQRGDLAGQHRQFGGIEGMRQIDQILAMIRQLGTLPGRKSVLLLTPGLATTGDPDLFKLMLDKANKANVTVYGIDVNGLSAELDPGQGSSTSLKHAASVSSSQSGAGGSASQNMEKMRQGDYINDAVRTSDVQAALRALSEGTGGFLVGNTNDLRKPFQRILEDVDTHYEVIYHPSSNRYDGRLRNIDVKTLRADVNVESQKGYFALPVLDTASELTPVEMAGLAALNVHTPPHAFDFKATAYHFRPNVATSQNEAVFEIPASNIQATPESGANRHRMHLSLLALVKDSSGQVVDKFSQDAPYQIPNENLAKARATTITLAHPLTLPAGHYTMETAVLDREANHASTSKVEFDSTDRNGVGLSSILLVQHVEPVTGKVDPANPLEFLASPTEGRRITPELSTNLGAAAKPVVFFVVYPDPSIADKPKIQAEFWVGGTLLAKQVADLPAPDATGAIPMQINTAAKPGNCELRITALQGNSSSKATLSYSIAAK